MNYLRLPLATGALMLAVALPAFAGHMQTGIMSPPPPATGEMQTTSTVVATGEMHTPIVAEIALSFMQSVLALF